MNKANVPSWGTWAGSKVSHRDKNKIDDNIRGKVETIRGPAKMKY
jgi:hypothetical protein